MTLAAPFDFKRWIDEHRHLLKPPVGNKCVVDGDFIVMVVGGPNARTDYHWDEGPEFFYQLEGEMVLKVQEDGRARDIPIRAGEIFYLPPRVPHSPQRMPESIGLVIERKRLPNEKDGLLWFCERCNHKLYEEFFTLHNIETDFPAVFDRFYGSLDARTCKAMRPRQSGAGEIPQLRFAGVPHVRSARSQYAPFPLSRLRERVGVREVLRRHSTPHSLERSAEALHSDCPHPALSRKRESGKARDLTTPATLTSSFSNERLKGCASPENTRLLPRMLRNLLELKPRDVPIRVALRNTAAVVVPLGIGIATDHVAAGLGIAAGALNTMFLDQPGPYRLRMQRMLLTAIAAGLSAFVGSVLGDNTPLLTLAALVWGIAGGLLVALGPNAGRAGLTSMILLVVTAASPRSPATALAAALLIFAGGVLQMMLAVAAWPLQRYRPERQALAALCVQLATSARAPTDHAQAPPVTEALLDVESLLHGEHRARGEIMETFRVLAGIVERIRRELIALGDLDRAIESC